MGFLNTLKTKMMNFNKKVEDAQEKVTFSQAGIHDNQTSEMSCIENQGRNLVVASNESWFADEMIEYSLEMAQRMEYDIIAVNAANITHDVTEFFSSTHEDLYKDFKQASAENVEPFRKRAEDLGLKFAHVTNFSDIYHAINDVGKECGQVEFVITENREPARIRDAAENTQRIAQRLFVYSVN